MHDFPDGNSPSLSKENHEIDDKLREGPPNPITEQSEDYAIVS